MLILAACADDAPRAAGVVVRDSAGVRIVETSAPAGAVRLGAEPVVVIGSVSGDEAHLFENPVGPALLADGSIVTGESSAYEVRFFDASGAHRFSTGGRGSGPGEFRSLTRLMLLPGDTLLAGDAPQGRLTWIAPDGRAVRSVQDWRYDALPLAGGRQVRIDRVSDGSGGRMGPARDSLGLIVFQPGTPAEDTVARLTGDDHFIVMLRLIDQESPRKLDLPYGRERVTATADERVFTGDGERFEVRVLGPDGTLREVWRRAWTPVPLTDAHVQAHVDRLASSQAELSRMLAVPLADAPYREHLAAYDRLVPTREGGLWVRHLGMVGDTAATWSVFTPDGRWLGEVQTPPRFELADVRGQRALGVTEDENDVPFLHVYEVSLAGPDA
jgi:hypothetical protein